MPIFFDEAQGLFHLQSRNTSYIIQLVHGYPAHAYFGAKLRHGSNLDQLLTFQERASFSPNPIPEDKSISLDSLPQEYPQYGTSDFRSPAYQVRLANGTRATELTYRSHRIVPGKPALEGLPAVYVEQDHEAETLELELEDRVSGLVVVLSYTVFAEFDAIARSARLTNGSSEPLQLERALSASVDFPDAAYDALYLSGAWARERHVQRRRLAPGVTGISSRRGSSSHQQNPFLALLRPDATEQQGEVYGFSLVYSGSFTAEAEVEQFGTTRVQIGINPFDFTWKLEPGESFQTPEAVLVYSADGLGGMSRTYHRLYRTRLCRGQFRDQERPILVNNWEATYFDFNADKIEAIAKAGSELGIELFVLDDGWFGRRDRDNSSLGDWFEDRRKLPDGLADLARRVKDTGLQFGLWFEPEMVSPDSDLYRAHPDWCLHVPDRRRTEARDQLILDMSRSDVRQYLYERLSTIFSTVPITYVKWDMNRNMTEIGSAVSPAERQGEVAHRYMLGLYELLERLTSEFPHILFESCSGGGGRFDPGMLYYMPQTWTSDDTDAAERLKIQYGTSIVYPVSTMGAHVSAVPNHQVERTTPLTFRGDVAMSGNFGYELDLTRFTEEEKETAKRQIAIYKEIRGLVQQGDLYRLQSPFEGNETAWMFVRPDQNEALLFYFRVLAEPNGPLRSVKLQGLDPAKDYEVVGSGEVYGGDRLMNAGLSMASVRGDFSSKMIHLKAKL
ncbi:alpha-galactosidase [Paenibacillus barengoltzii]|jgi:alpha-galactosidase|uniref:Alpha-galactosidase n=1 Tax=Paenibacillus barengoltzii J12 TaxID=935846 RepID=A0ABY1LXY0_9BACL|nr:alpha-galactosidase [Paenibacillus barengoltzii]SME94559.1 alpha-galactosidase [Paenibacillus barengoltzii]SMF29148.1 alpha-galactosidase [Paenibacillus barengoltzii J12]